MRGPLIGGIRNPIIDGALAVLLIVAIIFIIFSISSFIKAMKLRSIRLMSEVPEHKGMCYPTWLNTNSMYNRLDGGITGFFVLVGDPRHVLFHGIIVGDTVQSTEGRCM